LIVAASVGPQRPTELASSFLFSSPPDAAHKEPLTCRTVPDAGTIALFSRFIFVGN
jgi:hypothetical protein